MDSVAQEEIEFIGVDGAGEAMESRRGLRRSCAAKHASAHKQRIVPFGIWAAVWPVFLRQ
jgi:hypothetical protein